MFILYGNADLFLPYSDSLKEKRKIIQSIIGRIRKRFNVSICPVAYHDLWQRSTLGFAAVAISSNDINAIIDAIQQTLDDYEDLCQVTSFEQNIISHEC